MSTTIRTRFARSAAATFGAALVLAAVAPALAAGAPSGSDANQPENWVSYVEELGYTDVSCEKLEEGVEDKLNWTANGDFALVVVKAGSAQSTDNPNLEYTDVKEGDEVTAPSDKEISHIITCVGTVAEMPEVPEVPEEEEPTTPVEEPTTPVEEPTTPVEKPTTPVDVPKDDTPNGPKVSTDMPAQDNTVPLTLGGLGLMGLGIAGAGVALRKRA